MKTFSDFYLLKEEQQENETLNNPIKIKADTPMTYPDGLKAVIEAFKKSNDVEIGKDIDKDGKEKSVTIGKKNLYAVGGAVRDYLLGKTPRGGFDLASDAHPTQVGRILDAAGIDNEVKKDHAIVSVDGEEYKIAIFTKNGKGKNKQEDMGYGSMEDDAKSRDFTFNSLYYDLVSDQIIDYTGGVTDLKNKRVKFNNDPKKELSDNPLAGARYVRMHSMVNPKGKFDDKVSDAIQNSDMGEIDPKDLQGEFKKGLDHPDCDNAKFVRGMGNMGMLKHIFPDSNLDVTNLPTDRDKNITLAFVLKGNEPDRVAKSLSNAGMDGEQKNIGLLLKLLGFDGGSNVLNLKKDHLSSNLSRRKIKDWGEMMDIDEDMLDKFLSFNLSVPVRVRDEFGEDTLNPDLYDDFGDPPYTEDDIKQRLAVLEGKLFDDALWKH